MAISSLTKIGVPDAAGTSQGLLMPKLQYRFRVNFEGFGASADDPHALTKQVVDVTRPNVTFENMVLDVYNSKVNLAGKHTWNPITLTLRDDASNQVQKRVGAQLQKQFDFMEQSSARSGQDYKFKTVIQILDGGNGADNITVLEEWQVVGCYLSEVNYNTLAYATNDQVTVTLTIQYDNAIQYPFADGAGVTPIGVGSVLPRTIGSFVTGQGGQ